MIRHEAYATAMVPAPKEGTNNLASKEPTNTPAQKGGAKGTIQKGQAGKEPLKVPAGIEFRREVEHRPGGTGNQWHLDYAKPGHPAGPLPAIVMVHGGVLNSYMNEGEPGNAERPALHELEVCSPLLALAPGEQFCHASRVYQMRGDEAAIDRMCQRFFNTSLKGLKRFIRSGS